MKVKEMEKVSCDKERMRDKIVTFSKFGATGHGGITRLSLWEICMLLLKD